MWFANVRRDEFRGYQCETLRLFRRRITERFASPILRVNLVYYYVRRYRFCRKVKASKCLIHEGTFRYISSEIPLLLIYRSVPWWIKHFGVNFFYVLCVLGRVGGSPDREAIAATHRYLQH